MAIFIDFNPQDYILDYTGEPMHFEEDDKGELSATFIPWNKGKEGSMREYISRYTAEERSIKYGSHGKANPFYGKKHPKELQEEINKKISKRYILTHPNGTKENIINLNRYCKENGLNRDSLMKVMNTGNPVPYPKSRRKPTAAAFATVGYKIDMI